MSWLYRKRVRSKGRRVFADGQVRLRRWKETQKLSSWLISSRLPSASRRLWWATSSVAVHVQGIPLHPYSKWHPLCTILVLYFSLSEISISIVYCSFFLSLYICMYLSFHFFLVSLNKEGKILMHFMWKFVYLLEYFWLIVNGFIITWKMLLSDSLEY